MRNVAIDAGQRLTGHLASQPNQPKNRPQIALQKFNTPRNWPREPENATMPPIRHRHLRTGDQHF